MEMLLNIGVVFGANMAIAAALVCVIATFAGIVILGHVADKCYSENAGLVVRAAGLYAFCVAVQNLARLAN